MDARDPLEVLWEEFPEAGEPSPLCAKTQSQGYPIDPPRVILYHVEYHRAANNNFLRGVDRDVFLQELGEGTAPSRELLQAAVRAFLCAAFRLPDAQVHEGWCKIMSTVCAMLGTAMQLGYAEARPPVPAKGPVPRIPITPPLPPWAIMGYESRRPTPVEIEADLAYWKGLPVRLVETLIRAHLNARYRGHEGATPEGRSRIMATVREAIWDGVLDAVRRYPCPRSAERTPRPAPNPRSPKPRRP